MGNMMWKVMSVGATMLAGVVATKLADQVWRTFGQDDLDPDDPDSPIWEAVAYAALTGLAVGAARTFATRKAAAYYTKSAGHAPAALTKA
ncbi:MAG: DUF4235 domain-containing protein [Phycicoccus sp.]|nr:DUF4235 domain-containing protein [Phycicoccus sp.]